MIWTLICFALAFVTNPIVAFVIWLVPVIIIELFVWVCVAIGFIFGEVKVDTSDLALAKLANARHPKNLQKMQAEYDRLRAMTDSQKQIELSI